MKRRVIPAVCFVLILFAAFAYLYVNTFVRKHQHAVILFVVDGLDLNLLNAARQQLGRNPPTSDPDDPLIGDARRRVAYRSRLLNLDSLWNVALLDVQDAGRPVPDAGADATALACGKRVDNGYVAMDARNEALRSILYVAEQAQRATGLVTTSSLVRPELVAFYSNSKDGEAASYRNAQDLVYLNIDVVLGGGGRSFVPASVANERGRPDKRDLFKEAAQQGYTVVRTRDELNGISTWRTRQVFGVFAPDDFYFASLQPEGSTQPSLAEMTRTAISMLNYSINGYFLVIDHGLVARAAEQNLGKLAVNEVAEVDDAIASAVAYAGPDALVLVTNSYGLGALAPLPATGTAETLAPDAAVPARIGRGAARVEGPPVPPAPAAPVAWIAGPGGPATTRAQADWLRRRFDLGWFSANTPGLLQPQPAFRFQTRALPLAEPAWLMSRGEGSLQLRGVFNNTDVYDMLSEQF
jgi:alkaline phosphatase